jgi:hypothetical protein
MLLTRCRRLPRERFRCVPSMFDSSGVKIPCPTRWSAATTRHKSLAMIKRYGEAAEQRKRAPHQLKGVGL